MEIRFESFCLDTENETLTRSGETVPLRPKPFFVLRYLAERPHKLVRKDEILDGVWPDTHVSDTVLKVCIREIRQALDDTADIPRVIETAHGRGYRFIAKIRTPDTVSSRTIAGRRAEMAQLRNTWESVRQGVRQTVLIAGEPGIGKTALLEIFLREAVGETRIARGQCVDQYGAGEPFMPVLEAVSGLCRGPGGARALEVVSTVAPTWLAQMPWLINPSRRQEFAFEMQGATRQRMLREVAHFFEDLAAERPLVVALEDLHWSDYSTLDVLSFLTARKDSARLLVIGTYRPVELMIAQHPLWRVRQEMEARRQGTVISLGLLDLQETREYVQLRLPEASADIAVWLHERTEGNPLFMENLVDRVAARGARTSIPDGIRQMIESRIGRLDAEQRRALAAASVAGDQFTPDTLAAALERGVDVVEEICHRLARHHEFLQSAASGYRFTHSLYREVLYQGIAAGTRAQFHRRIGAHLAVIEPDAAQELALHFDRGGDAARAASYYAVAAHKALAQSAHPEAAELARRGLELAAGLKTSDQRDRCEFELRVALGTSLAMRNGYGSTEAGDCLRRAWQLWQAMGEPVECAPMLGGVWRFHIIRAELGAARSIAERLQAMARRNSRPALQVEADFALGVTLVNVGDFIEAAAHFERAVSLCDAHGYDGEAPLLAHPSVACRAFGAWALCSLGDSATAFEWAQRAVDIGRRCGHPENLCLGLLFAAWVPHLCGEAAPVLRYSRVLSRFANYHGVMQFVAFGHLLEGWAWAQMGEEKRGIRIMRDTIGRFRDMGSEASLPHFLSLLAEALGRTGHSNEALRLLDEAVEIAGRTGCLYYQGETERIRTEIARRRSAAEHA